MLLHQQYCSVVWRFVPDTLWDIRVCISPPVTEDSLYWAECGHRTLTAGDTYSNHVHWRAKRETCKLASPHRSLWSRDTNRNNSVMPFPRSVPAATAAGPTGQTAPSRSAKQETVLSPVVIIRTTRFKIQQFYVLPTQCIYVFCVDVRTNSDYFTVQH